MPGAEVTCHRRVEAGRPLSMLVWRPDAPWRCAATTLVGGGVGVRSWWLNAQVPMDYARLDGAAHLAELAEGLGLRGEGVGMLTGVDVAGVCRAADGGVVVWATVGLGTPTWAAADDEPALLRRSPPGTVNLLVTVPVPMADAALVNLVATAAEAKAQALFELGVPGTGTASDAVAVAAPLPVASQAADAEIFGGPRSQWGARVARAVHAAVHAGAGPDPRWSDGGGHA